MPEENTQETEGTENQPAGDSQTFAQEQVNQLVGAARKKERAKYEGFKFWNSGNLAGSQTCRASLSD